MRRTDVSLMELDLVLMLILKKMVVGDDPPAVFFTRIGSMGTLSLNRMPKSLWEKMDV